MYARDAHAKLINNILQKIKKIKYDECEMDEKSCPSIHVHVYIWTTVV